MTTQHGGHIFSIYNFDSHLVIQTIFNLHQPNLPDKIWFYLGLRVIDESFWMHAQRIKQEPDQFIQMPKKLNTCK